MSHHEIPAVTQLQADVRCVWRLEEEAITYNRGSVMPDSYVELIVNCGAPLYLATDGGAQVDLPRVFLNGIQRKPLQLRALGLCQVISVRLYPWAAHALLGVPANPANETITALDSAWQAVGKSVAATVHSQGYEAGMYQLQEHVARVRHPAPYDLHAIRSATQELYAASGQVRIEALASQTALSTSQFERRFKAFVGVTPKTMARVIRFETIRNSLFINPQRRTVDLVQDFGYTDQAHFIHDFKAFANVTPGEFIRVNGEKGRNR